MKIKILYFAELRDAIGKGEEDVETGATSIGALASELAARHEAIRARLGSIRFAKNEAFASNDEAITGGDVVALLPPVAGG